jgi:hypothetical protein
MKMLAYKLTRTKSWAMTFALFILLTICTKSASSQNISSVPDPDFSGDNASETQDGINFKWKLTGSWFGNGLFVFDKWEPQGLVGALGFQYIAREGTTAGTTTLTNINTSGYGFLGAGTHTVSVSCDEITHYTFPFPYDYTTGYIKGHTYIVNVIYN